MRMKKYLAGTFLILLFLVLNCFALTQNEKLWLGVNSQQILTNRWSTYIFSQLRFIDESHSWQTGLIEGGVGYHFVKDQSFWIGYRWSGHHPYDGFYQENRLFQQSIKEINLVSSDFIYRARLEEAERGNSRQISIIFRQKFSLAIHHELKPNVRPLLYDEIFFQLHPTDYTTNKLISENRMFIGLNWYISSKTGYEIGYINQFQIKTPSNKQNVMSHIISLTYNF